MAGADAECFSADVQNAEKLGFQQHFCSLLPGDFPQRGLFWGYEHQGEM